MDCEKNLAKDNNWAMQARRVATKKRKKRNGMYVKLENSTMNDLRQPVERPLYKLSRSGMNL